MLQRNKAYAVGDIAYSPNLKSYEYLECITAGTTGDTEPDFSESQTGGVISDGTAQFQIVDQKQDGTDIDALKTELEAVKSSLAAVQTAISDTQNFKIIYPNGGSASNPENIKNGQKEYTENNPFSGYYVFCIPEIKYQNKWFNPGWCTSQDWSYGVRAYQESVSDQIVIRTGRYLAGNTNWAGLPVPDIGDSTIAEAPCRVLVYKLGKI